MAKIMEKRGMREILIESNHFLVKLVWVQKKMAGIIEIMYYEASLQTTGSCPIKSNSYSPKKNTMRAGGMKKVVRITLPLFR